MSLHPDLRKHGFKVVGDRRAEGQWQGGPAWIERTRGRQSYRVGIGSRWPAGSHTRVQVFQGDMPVLSALDEVWARSPNAVWEDAAAAFGLDARPPRLLGTLAGFPVVVHALMEQRCEVLLSGLPTAPAARKGRGHTGNVVLDMLVDAQDIPPQAVDALLAVINEYPESVLADGRLRLLGRVLPAQALERAQALAQALSGQ